MFYFGYNTSCCDRVVLIVSLGYEGVVDSLVIAVDIGFELGTINEDMLGCNVACINGAVHSVKGGTEDVDIIDLLGFGPSEAVGEAVLFDEIVGDETASVVEFFGVTDEVRGDLGVPEDGTGVDTGDEATTTSFIDSDFEGLVIIEEGEEVF